ncbi:hypothetical protein BDV3_001618 [Batrachochytrium dendrobatidis]
MAMTQDNHKRVQLANLHHVKSDTPSWKDIPRFGPNPAKLLAQQQPIADLFPPRLRRYLNHHVHEQYYPPRNCQTNLHTQRPHSKPIILSRGKPRPSGQQSFIPNISTATFIPTEPLNTTPSHDGIDYHIVYDTHKKHAHDLPFPGSCNASITHLRQSDRIRLAALIHNLATIQTQHKHLALQMDTVSKQKKELEIELGKARFENTGLADQHKDVVCELLKSKKQLEFYESQLQDLQCKIAENQNRQDLTKMDSQNDRYTQMCSKSTSPMNVPKDNFEPELPQVQNGIEHVDATSALSSQDRNISNPFNKTMTGTHGAIQDQNNIYNHSLEKAEDSRMHSDKSIIERQAELEKILDSHDNPNSYSDAFHQSVSDSATSEQENSEHAGMNLENILLSVLRQRASKSTKREKKFAQAKYCDRATSPNIADDNPADSSEKKKCTIAEHIDRLLGQRSYINTVSESDDSLIANQSQSNPYINTDNTRTCLSKDQQPKPESYNTRNSYVGIESETNAKRQSPILVPQQPQFLDPSAAISFDNTVHSNNTKLNSAQTVHNGQQDHEKSSRHSTNAPQMKQHSKQSIHSFVTPISSSGSYLTHTGICTCACMQCISVDLSGTPTVTTIPSSASSFTTMSIHCPVCCGCVSHHSSQKYTSKICSKQTGNDSLKSQKESSESEKVIVDAKSFKKPTNISLQSVKSPSATRIIEVSGSSVLYSNGSLTSSEINRPRDDSSGLGYTRSFSEAFKLIPQDASFLFANDTSMLKSLAQIVCELET